MSLHELARRLNGAVNAGWINIRGPHHSASDRSLGIRFDAAAPDGFRVHSLAGEVESECRAHVKSLIQKLNGEFCDICEPEHPPREGIVARTKQAMALWQEGTSPIGTLVEVYLNGRRCALESIPGNDVIRFHPACPFGTLRVPAMVALITDAVIGEPIGIHRTAIKDDGSGKRFGGDSKKVLGLARRGVIRLQPASDRVGIAEGVESALSAAQVFGTAVWAGTSAGGIAAFPILKGIKRLTVFADHDEPGLKAACACCRRYQAAGIDAKLRYPARADSDWNDFMMQESSVCP